MISLLTPFLALALTASSQGPSDVASARDDSLARNRALALLWGELDSDRGVTT